MRFLDTWTGQSVERDPKETDYAILSHTWRKREQTYDEVKIVQARHGHRSRVGYISRAASPSSEPPPDLDHISHSIWYDDELSGKIRSACAVACRAGYRYLWIDSCCIDKTSSSELSEAINSIFNWYRDAQVCYAFLSDVLSLEGNTSAFSDS